MASAILLLLFSSLFSETFAQTGPVVDTTYGPVLGVDVTLNSGDVIQSFMGIPFARAPVGDLRFAVSNAYIVDKHVKT